MELIELAKTAMTVNKLLDGDAFSKALDAIAGVDIKTAKYAIKNHTKYANPREALNTALGNLIHAHIALEEKYSKWRVKLTQGFLLNFQLETDAYVCCLIAILHRALGNKKEVIKEAFDWAVKAFFEAPCSSFRVALDLFNPIVWFRLITTKSKISSGDIEKCLYIIQEQEGFAPKIKINDIFPDNSDNSDYTEIEDHPIHYG